MSFSWKIPLTFFMIFLFQDFEIMGKAGKIVRLVRVMRVMRIFKLVRHFAGLQSLIYTLNQAYKGKYSLLIGRHKVMLISDWLLRAGVADAAGRSSSSYLCFPGLLRREG